MGLTRYIANQFGNPKGIGGRISTYIMNRLNQKMYKTVLSEIKDNKKVLDIGFGNGYLIKKLVPKTDATIYGIDISEDMVKLATKRNKKRALMKK